MATVDETAGHDGKCGGKKRQGEGTCTQAAGWGTDHPGFGRCKLHGGKTPTHKISAREERAKALAVTLGVPIEVDPKEAILQQIYWRHGAVAWWRERVRALDPEALVWGVVKTSKGFGPQGPVDVTDEAAEVSVYLAQYLAAQAALESLCIQAVKIGLDERRVRLAEQQQAELAEGFRWLVGEARLRLDLSEAEGSCLMDLVGEMMGRLDRMESAAKV